MLADFPRIYNTRLEALDDTIARELLLYQKVKQSKDSYCARSISLECSDTFCLWKIGFRIATKNGIKTFCPRGDNISNSL